jgi:hypothetical protein
MYVSLGAWGGREVFAADEVVSNSVLETKRMSAEPPIHSIRTSRVGIRWSQVEVLSISPISGMTVWEVC